MRRLLLVGASEHGRVVADLAEILGWGPIVFVDDRWPDIAENGVWSVAGTTDDLAERGSTHDGVLVSIGANDARLRLHRKLLDLSVDVPTLVHPSAVVSRYATIGRGSVVLAQAVVGSFAVVGDAVILNTAATVDHDCVLGDGVHVSPGAHLGGKVSVGARAWIGIGASVREGIAIGSDAMIGAGAAVVSPIGDGAVGVGVPARPRD